MNQLTKHFRPISTPWMATVAILASLLTPALARAAYESEQDRLKESGDTLKEITSGKPGIPQDILNKSECVIVLPNVKKAGLIVGGEYGKGAMSCRSGDNFDGHWSAPIMMQSKGGSFGLQVGGESIDFVILVMNDKGARAVIKGQAKLGGDASVAAGPVGRTAEASTTATMAAEMLSYSRSQGVFGGLSLAGTTLGPDDGANEKVYGKKITGEEIFSGSVQPPASAEVLLSTLKTKSPKNLSKGH